MSAVIKFVPAPPFDVKEIRRYASVPEGSDGVIRECISEMDVPFFRVAFAEYEIKAEKEMLDLGFCKVASRDLARAFDGCERVLLFASTAGEKPDRLIRRYSSFMPEKAVIMQAIGTERVESVLDAFQKEAAEGYEREGYSLTPRVSPGYGDIPLSMQKDIFSALEITKNLGITLSDTLFMTPTKSVTALAGIRKRGDKK